ncbi:uncharacterized protein [Lolium perenne]|uniref:uncharacterized protein isoform X2 n=1 Tax=Lolium perenne TaxID=4522 RepID=UPI0021F69B9B|nr:uncharacterized protein LOC127335633 isoform X2 [Lolium perenne]
MHLWPSLRIRDSFKHAYLEKLELNLAGKKRASRQGQDEDQDKGQQQEPLIEVPPSSRGSMVASALELAWDAAMLLTCCCCCFCCGAFGEEDDHLTGR